MKDADVQTSLEEINIHPDVKQNQSISACTDSLLPCPSVAMTTGVSAAPDHQYYTQPGLDVHTSGVRQVSDGHRVSRDEAGFLPESGRDRTHLRGRTGDWSGTGSDLPLSTRSAPAVLSSGTHKSGKTKTQLSNGDTDKKLPSSDTRVASYIRRPADSSRRSRDDTDVGNRVPSRAADRGPAANICGRVPADGNIENRVPSYISRPADSLRRSRDDTDVGGRVPSQAVDRVPYADSCDRVLADGDIDNRVPSYTRRHANSPGRSRADTNAGDREPSRVADRGSSVDSCGRVPADGDVKNMVPSSRTGVASRTAGRGGVQPANNGGRVPTDSDNNDIDHSPTERLSRRHRSGTGDATDAEAKDYQQFLLPRNADEDLSSTPWSEGSPRRQLRLQLPLVCTDLSV